MSNNEENLADEDTFEEMADSYRVNATEYNENYEDTVEYLDLDLDVNSAIPESTEEYIQDEPPPSRTKPRVIQSSVLKTNYLEPVKLKRKQTQKRKPDCPASVTIHTAVETVNAKLADSAWSLDGQGRNNASNKKIQSQTQRFPGASGENSQPSDAIKTDIKTEDDGLDLFFQSMAQTVLHLPSQVQAKIKMEICKVIAMAEIKYSTCDAVADVDKL